MVLLSTQLQALFSNLPCKKQMCVCVYGEKKKPQMNAEAMYLPTRWRSTPAVPVFSYAPPPKAGREFWSASSLRLTFSRTCFVYSPLHLKDGDIVRSERVSLSCPSRSTMENRQLTNSTEHKRLFISWRYSAGGTASERSIMEVNFAPCPLPLCPDLLSMTLGFPGFLMFRPRSYPRFPASTVTSWKLNSGPSDLLKSSLLMDYCAETISS